MSVGDLKVLLIDSLGSAYDERQSLLQRARRTSLDYQRLLQETQSKEILLHCIVHDLRGPLTGIKACLDLLVRQPLGQRAQPLLDTATKASSKLEGLVADILDIFGAEVASLARFGLDEGRRPDVAVVIKEVVNMMGSVASRESVGLRLDPEADWEQAYSALAEESRLERVLFNLLDNALRHAPSGSMVTVGLRRERGSCLVSVEDEGDGLPPELASTFFQKFSSGARKGKAGLGHEKRPGKVKMADKGTLFLDEVGDMPLDLQPKLLTVLQDRVFQRIGSNKNISVDVRVLAATHRNLEELCQEQRFREDLYFRLDVLPIHIAPLRERPEDIQLLVAHLLGEISNRRGRVTPEITSAAMDRLKSFHWPGNIRQLENVLERVTAFTDSSEIGPADLPPEIRAGVCGTVRAESLAGMPLLEVEKLAVTQTLELCSGNKAEAARRLGVSEKTIYNMLKRHGLS